jgi:hypothetical protein
MLWIYLIAAAVIAWGLARDLARRETWMIGFGRVTRRDKPGNYWLTILLRGYNFLVILVAAWFRSTL